MHRFRLLLSLVALVALTTAGCSSRVDAGPRPNFAAGEKIREELKKSTGGEAAPAEEEAAGGTASGWGTLSGVFLFDGVAPKPAPIIPDKDAEVCGKHPLFNESIEVGPGGGLENMVIWLRTPKVPVNPKYDSQAGKEIELDNKDCRFQPHVVLVRTNETLKIKNSDPVGHNSKLEPAKNPAFNSLIPTGQSADLHLTNEETLPIKVGCSIHPWMGVDRRAGRSLCRGQRQGWPFHHRRSAGRQGAGVPAVAGKGGLCQRGRSRRGQGRRQGAVQAEAFARRGQKADVQGFAEITERHSRPTSARSDAQVRPERRKIE